MAAPAPAIRLSLAAELSGISERTLRRQAMRGKIPGARQDDIGHWWIPETAVGTLERGKAGNPQWKAGVPQPRAKKAKARVRATPLRRRKKRATSRSKAR